MSAVFKSVIAATLLAGSSFAATAPAQAHDRTGVAIAAGIIGLGVGAAIASDHPHYARSGYYEDAPGYDYAPAYYAPAPVAYYGGGYDYGYGGGYYDGGRGYRSHYDRGDRHYRDNDRRGGDRDRGDHRDWDRGDRH